MVIRACLKIEKMMDFCTKVSKFQGENRRKYCFGQIDSAFVFANSPSIKAIIEIFCR